MPHEFQPGDLIGYNSPDEGYIYGIVSDVYEDGMKAEYLDDSWDEFWVEIDKAEYIEPVYLDDNLVLKFARFEIPFSKLTDNIFPPQRVRAKERHVLTIDELICVLEKAAQIPPEQFVDEWYNPIRCFLTQSYDYGRYDMYNAGDSGYRFLPPETYCVWSAMDSLDIDLNDNKDAIRQAINDLQSWKELYGLPVEKRPYPEFVKTGYIKSFDKGNMLDKATNDELALFIQYVEELCGKDNKAALYAKAYGCYGGNRAFPCDWCTSRDTLLHLCELDDNPYLANTLGYIYYYGRCTDGKPEYEKAFHYFSIGAAGGIYESQYKLSDMFRHGYGISQSNKLASEIIWRLYDENIKYIYDNELNCKFADVALRTGNLFKEGIGVDADMNAAYYYYLQADFAIRMRLLEDNHYGDTKVADGIRKSIDEILPQTKYKKPKKTVRYLDLEKILRHRCADNRRLEMKIKKSKDGEMLIKVRILPRGDEKYQTKLFITEPAAQFCGLCDNISIKTVHCEKLYLGNKIFRDESTTLIFDFVNGDELFLYGNKVAEFVCDEYTVIYPGKEKRGTAHFVSVVFHDGGRTYDYICNVQDVVIGDKVIVETDQGETEVEVVRVFDKDSTETALPISKYKAIIRKA